MASLLDVSDKIASVASAALSIVTLLLSIFWRRADRRGELVSSSSPRPSGLALSTESVEERRPPYRPQHLGGVRTAPWREPRLWFGVLSAFFLMITVLILWTNLGAHGNPLRRVAEVFLWTNLIVTFLVGSTYVVRRRFRRGFTLILAGLLGAALGLPLVDYLTS